MVAASVAKQEGRMQVLKLRNDKLLSENLSLDCHVAIAPRNDGS